jgi:hypothetical protein
MMWGVQESKTLSSLANPRLKAERLPWQRTFSLPASKLFSCTVLLRRYLVILTGPLPKQKS